MPTPRMEVEEPEAKARGEPIHILLVEDNPGDVRLTLEAFRGSKMRNQIDVARDGEEALDYLHRRGAFTDAPRADLILLDLNLPKVHGREVLAEIKEDPELRSTPVVILTTSQADADILKSYDLHANCYVTKPLDLQQFVAVVRSIENFWLAIVKLPPRRTR